MSGNRTVTLRPRAEEDLAKTFDYSVENFGLKRAIQYIEDIDKAFKELANNPMLARNYDHVRPGLRAYSVVSHIVFFKSSDTKITIIRVLHKSMDVARHL